MRNRTNVFRSGLFATCAALLFATSGWAGSRAGIQAVVFSRWSEKSVSNLVATVNSVVPARFELGQAPYFAPAASRWANTLRFLRDVNSTTATTLTIYLSFHTDQPHELATRAGSLNKFLATSWPELGGRQPLDRVTALVISPELEDDYPTDAAWMNATRTVLGSLDTKVIASGKLSLRLSSRLNSATTLSSMKYSSGGTTYSLPVRIERHGVERTPESGIWSNDGDFVYYTNPSFSVIEDALSMKDTTQSFDTMALAGFITSANGRTGPTNLWRPAYNLFLRSTVSNRVVWTRSGDAWTRNDSNDNPAFNAREMQALAKLLREVK